MQESLALARQLKDPYYEGQALYDLGRMLINQGQLNPEQSAGLYGRACACLDQAIQIFETLSACFDLQRARALRVLFSEDGTHLVASPRASEVQAQVDSLRSRLGLPESEWYQATVLEALLTPGQEAGKGGIDEEFVFETIAFLQPSLIHFIQENGGSVIHARNGITGIFGALAAHEDDPARAVETAIQIANFYRELHQQTELPILLHIGMAQGKIVAGRVGSDLQDEFSAGEFYAGGEFLAAGDTLLAAHILAESCPAARVWVTQDVRNATAARFEYAPLSPDLVTRLPDVAIYQLEGLRAQIQPVRGLIGLKTPFIGRKKELEALCQASQALDEGHGALAWVEGDAGIGKSRLMREFSLLLQEQGREVWWGAGTQRHADFAFSLFSDLLCHAFDVQFNLSPQEINQRIDLKLERWPEELQEIRPFIQLLVGVTPGGVQGERLAEMEPEQLRRQTFVAVHRLISLHARQQPLVLLLDDLQWIDATSADLLLYLSHLTMSYPVLFVCAQRRGEAGAFDRARTRVQSMYPDRFIHLNMQSLTTEACYQLLQEFLASANLAGEVQSLIVQQSGGNPYYIEEFVRMLIEQDYLRVVRDRLEINQALEIRRLPIPASLESLIRARIDTLAAPARQILQVASVIGQQFHGQLVARVAEQEDIDPLLDLLAGRGMLRPADKSGYWEFSHPLIESIVYTMLLRAERKLLHLRTAELLEQQWRGHESEHADELAYHFGKAEVYRKALDYLVTAAEQAAARYANDAAVAFFERASDYLSVVPDAGDECRFRICAGLGQVYMLIGNYDASIAALEGGLHLLGSTQLPAHLLAGLYRHLGDTAFKKGEPDAALAYLQRALETLDVPVDAQGEAEAARIYARLGYTYFMKANLDQATEAVLKAETYARQSNSLSALAATSNLLGGIHYRQGDTRAAMCHTQQAMLHWQEMGYTWGVAAGLSNLAILEAAAGNWKASSTFLEQATRMRKEMGDIEGLAINYNNLGILLRDSGDLAQAEQYLRDGLAIFRPFQMNWQTANTLMGLGQVLLYQGRVDDAETTLQDGLRLAREINARDVLAEMQLARAEVALARGNLENAIELARSSVRLAAEIQSHVIEAMAWRMIARCQVRQGQLLDAHKSISTAWEILGADSDELETGRMHAQSAIIFRSLKFPERAANHHQAAKEIFQRLGALRDLAQLEPQAATGR